MLKVTPLVFQEVLRGRPKPIAYAPEKHSRSWAHAQSKVNGWRLTLAFGGMPQSFWGAGRFSGDWALSDNFFIDRPSVIPIVDDLFLANTIIDGELYVPGGVATDVPRMIKHDPTRLCFSVFAAPVVYGVDHRHTACPVEACSAYLARVRILGRGKRAFHTTTRPRKHFEGLTVDQMIQNAIPTQHPEGWVLKGHHWRDWYKIKREHTFDLIIYGSTEGKGKYSGQIGALTLGAFDSHGKIQFVCNTSGMTDAERAMFTNLRDHGDLHGRVVEVRCQEVTRAGRLTHPRFVRERPDRPFNDPSITLETIES